MSNNHSRNQNARTVCYIPPDSFVEGKGFRVAFVVEGEKGYCPTGDWPYNGRVGEQMPWFWGVAGGQEGLTLAQKLAVDYNNRLGISEEDALVIIFDSMQDTISDGNHRSSIRKK